jgi:hypothetical protein
MTAFGDSVKTKEQHMRKLKNRKIVRYVVEVDCAGVGYPPGTHRAIHLTKRQLEKLSRIPTGKDVFLSNFYGGAGYRVLRTPDGLQYLPFMFLPDSDGTKWLEDLLTLPSPPSPA